MADEIITIRTATPEDAEPLTGLLTAAYRELEKGPYDREQLANALPAMSRANPRLLGSGTYYIAEIDGASGACGGWTAEKPGSGEVVEGVAHIRHFATHPDYMRRGLARMLLARCIDEASVCGLLLLKTQATLLAEKFYASAGFRAVGPIEVTFAPGITLPATEMERRLP